MVWCGDEVGGELVWLGEVVSGGPEGASWCGVVWCGGVDNAG